MYLPGVDYLQEILKYRLLVFIEDESTVRERCAKCSTRIVAGNTSVKVVGKHSRTIYAKLCKPCGDAIQIMRVLGGR